MLREKPSFPTGNREDDETGPVSLVLASASPRRQELLAGLGTEFEVEVSGEAEDVQPNESPEDLVKRLALSKASSVARVPRIEFETGPGRRYGGGYGRSYTRKTRGRCRGT